MSSQYHRGLEPLKQTGGSRKEKNNFFVHKRTFNVEWLAFNPLVLSCRTRRSENMCSEQQFFDQAIRVLRNHCCECRESCRWANIHVVRDCLVANTWNSIGTRTCHWAGFGTKQVPVQRRRVREVCDNNPPEVGTGTTGTSVRVHGSLRDLFLFRDKKKLFSTKGGSVNK